VNTPQNPQNPLLKGWYAAKANFLPGLFVQVAVVLTLLGYGFHEPTRQFLFHLAALKEAMGFWFAALSGAIAGAVLPELLTIAVFQKGRVTRANWDNFVFAALFWASQGVCVDFFYRGQALVFGTGADAATIAKKVLVDQLLYTPLFAAPLAVYVFEWRNRGYRFAGFSSLFTWAFYRDHILPTQVANWCMWVPMTSMIYSLPSLLQIPLFSFALSFWVMIFTWMNRAEKKV
jgi:hypothetical protein